MVFCYIGLFPFLIYKELVKWNDGFTIGHIHIRYFLLNPGISWLICTYLDFFIKSVNMPMYDCA